MILPSGRINGRIIIDVEGGSKIVKRSYHYCHFCSGTVSEQKVTVDYRWGEELITVIKNVPAGVCEVCGEKYFKAAVVKAMEKTARSRRKPKEVLQVPVRELKVA
jgi:YgiT-type zinc finger domain-containing protein